MATPTLLPTLCMWLLSASLLAEATYYRHHRYIPHFYRYREHSANTENHLPDVSNPVPEVTQSGAPTHPEIPHVFHPAPEVIQPIPDVFQPAPEVIQPLPEVYHTVPEVVYPAPELFLPPKVHQPSPDDDLPAGPRVFYGVMFDAGSTGTRIHIYKFIQKDPGKPPLSRPAAGIYLHVLLTPTLYAVRSLAGWCNEKRNAQEGSMATLKVAEMDI